MATFPTLSTGATTQRPYSYTREFINSIADVETGQRYAYNWLATPLLRWALNFSMIPDADVGTLQTFFAARNGRYDTFTFVDPETGTSYSTCRFGQDNFPRVYRHKNYNSLTLIVEQTA